MGLGGGAEMGRAGGEASREDEEHGAAATEGREGGQSVSELTCERGLAAEGREARGLASQSERKRGGPSFCARARWTTRGGGVRKGSGSTGTEGRGGRASGRGGTDGRRRSTRSLGQREGRRRVGLLLGRGRGRAGGEARSSEGGRAKGDRGRGRPRERATNEPRAPAATTTTTGGVDSCPTRQAGSPRPVAPIGCRERSLGRPTRAACSLMTPSSLGSRACWPGPPEDGTTLLALARGLDGPLRLLLPKGNQPPESEAC